MTPSLEKSTGSAQGAFGSAFQAVIGTKKSVANPAAGSLGGFGSVTGKACENAACMGSIAGGGGPGSAPLSLSAAPPSAAGTAVAVQMTPVKTGGGAPVAAGSPIPPVQPKGDKVPMTCPEGTQVGPVIIRDGRTKQRCVSGVSNMVVLPEEGPQPDLQKGLEMIADDAAEEARNRFLNFETESNILYNEEGDAWRHARANQESIQWLIEQGYPAPLAAAIAFSAGTYHEFEGAWEGTPWDEFWMDMHNNWQGLGAGMTSDDPELIDEMLRDGKLKTLENGLTPEQMERF